MAVAVLLAPTGRVAAVVPRVDDGRAAILPQQSLSAEAALVSLLVVPDTLLADGKATKALYVELFDAAGEPAPSTEPTIVRLGSSDARLATIPATVTIPTGRSAALVEVTVGRSEGEVTFTADADGLTSAQTVVKLMASSETVTSTALFKVALGPALSILGSSGPALVTVSVINGESNTPLLQQEDLEVALVSSDATVLAVPPSVTVPAGSYTVTTGVTVGRQGGATITALRSGFSSGSIPGSVRRPGLGVPAKLTVVALPALFSPAGDTASRLAIQALDVDGAPVFFPCGQLQLSSSNPRVLDVPAKVELDCLAEQQAVLVDTIPGDSAGNSGVTVAASGLLPGEVTIAAAGVAPSKLIASIAPTRVLYGQASAGWLVIQVTNDKNVAATVARDMVVTLTASGVALPATVTIPRGTRVFTVPLGPLAADAPPPSITASAGRLAPAQVNIATTDDLGSVSDGGGGGLPSLEIAGRSIPFTWLLGIIAIAVLGALLVFFVDRPERGM